MKKMTKDEIRALKKKHRLERVMQETGEVFEVDAKHSELWHSTTMAGLSVDITRQLFEIRRPGMDVQSGDVIAWLQLRYRWSFAYAMSFLQKRPADPEITQAPKKQKSNKRQAIIIDDAIEPIDHWQSKALEIAGERIRPYFKWNVAMFMFHRSYHLTRIEPVYAPLTTHCDRCEQRIDWLGALKRNEVDVPVLHGYIHEQVGSLPVVAYSIKKVVNLTDVYVKGDEDIHAALNDLIDNLDNLFIEDPMDGVVCVECAIKELRFQIALELCERSAERRYQEENKTVRDSAAGWEPVNELL